jgi:plasmid stabilization system protein ParE
MAQAAHSPNAIANLESLHRFLAEKNSDAATRALRTIRDRMRILARFPRLGPVDPEQTDYRQLFIPFGAAGYLARYRVEGRLVVVLAIRHMREAGHELER